MVGAVKKLIERLRRLMSDPLPPAADPVQRLLADAQAARDAGDAWRALGFYRSAMALRPDDPGVMVLFGNMIKDSGDAEGALRVYRRILTINPEQADVWLQTGHALKLSGDIPAAQDAYERALLIEPDLPGALRELETDSLARHLARRFEAMADGASPDVAADLAARLDRLAAEAATLRRQIEDVEGLRHLPPKRFDLFSERYPVPRPKNHRENGAIHFVADETLQPPALHALVAACNALERGDWTLSTTACAEDTRRYAAADPRIRCEARSDPAPDDWIIHLNGAWPHPLFSDWLAWAGTETAAAAFTFDEVERTGQEGGRLVLREKPDPERMVARPDALPYAVRANVSGEDFAALVVTGRTGHLPLPLLARAKIPPAALSPDYPPAPDAAGKVHTLSVIIPSSDHADMAERFVDSLVQKADDPARIHFILINNDARKDAATAAFERMGKRSDAVVIDDGTPFNWSLLNNRAASTSDSDALIFANDDMLMISSGWDTRLAAQLNRPEIGVVGVRLFFPDDTLQHAGVQLGWRGGSIHEGLGVAAGTPGPSARWTTPRLASAVTGAFLGVRREVFAELGGFDATLLPVSHSDLDFCLKARAEGLRILYDPGVMLYHFESTSRGYDAENAEKQARFDAEKHVFETRWGVASKAEPGVNPFWSDYHAPFHFISQPSLAAIEDSIRASAARDIWRIDLLSKEDE